MSAGNKLDHAHLANHQVIIGKQLMIVDCGIDIVQCLIKIKIQAIVMYMVNY